MREKAKGEMGLGAGELKSLRNDWWEIKTVARTEESQLDCKLIGGVHPSQLGAWYKPDAQSILDLGSRGKETQYIVRRLLGSN